MDFRQILVRAPNWVGDAVLSLPALRALRSRFPAARIHVLAKPWVADLYRRESCCHELIPYTAATLAEKWRAGRALAARGFDCAILLPNSFESAALAVAARVPERIGYARDARGWLLTRAVPPPRPGQIPPHQRYYYLELLRRAGVVSAIPACGSICLEGAEEARTAGRERMRRAGFAGDVIGVSPGAAYGSAKRWLPERFAEAAGRLARELDAGVAVFGSAAEREICAAVAAAAGSPAKSFAGETTLARFIEMAAACRAFLTNDSGAMHVAAALGVPTVAVFGPTDERATGPAGPLVKVVRHTVECSPCLKRDCPIDHRCMTRVPASSVAQAMLNLME